MTSLFIDSSTRIDGDYYVIPTQIEFSSLKLRSAIILNNQYNVQGFSVNLTIPSSSFAMNFPISDGYYSGTELADELQRLINAEFVDDNWNITFSNSNRNFTFQYKNNSTSTAYLTFNTASVLFFGTNVLTFVTDAVNKEGIQQGNQSINVQSFYRIECPSLSFLGYMGHKSPRSGLLGIVPVTGKFGQYTIYDNPDSFFMSSNGINDIYNHIQVRIFIGDSQTPVVNPIFGVCLQFQ